MISYKKDKNGKVIDLAYLEALINKHDATWLNRAAVRTAKYKTAGKVTDSAPIWSEIKEVYMKLQGNKCAFCETELEGKTSGKGVHDVEHFRPKNRISKWKSSEEFKAFRISITDPGVTKGYHLLTYNLLNYTMACGPCNQTLKSDQFPIKGNYNTLMEDPLTESATEIPLLLYPIGQVDDDCESLISFQGPIPVPVAKKGIKLHRARTTIDFFSLHRSDERGRLFRERCEKIITISGLLSKDDDPDDYENILKNLLADHSNHANCARSYIKLLKTDKTKAAEILEEAKQFVRTYIPDGELD